MRTRNRGQKRSIVSSLGLGPKQNKRKALREMKLNETKKYGLKARSIRKNIFKRSENILIIGQSESSNFGDKCREGKRRGRKPLHISNQASVLSSLNDSANMSSVSLFHNDSTVKSEVNSLPEFIKVISNKLTTKVPDNQNSGKLGYVDTKVKKGNRGRPRSDKSNLQNAVVRGHENANDNLKAVSDNKSSEDIKAVKSVCTAEISSQINKSDVEVHAITKNDSKNNQSVCSVPVKRRRGRPPLNSYIPVQNEEPVKVKSEDNNMSNSYSTVSSNLADQHCTLKNLEKQCDLSESKCASLIDKHLIRLSSTGTPIGLQFGATDEVLQEVLAEVNMFGAIKTPLKRTKKERHKGVCMQSLKMIDKKYEIKFDSLFISQIFDAVCLEVELNNQLSTKDLFLAMNGLLRPGICEVSRRRREDRSKQLSRNLMGRLRPNPRPRRYSDMVSPPINMQSSHHNNLLRVESLYNNDKLRHQSSRSTTVSAARLTAIKKLIRAKTHHTGQSTNQLVPLKSQSTCLHDEFRGQNSYHMNSRTRSHRSNVANRNTRFPDVSHHIDWKFCYATSNKSNLPIVMAASPSKRRRTLGLGSKLRSDLDQTSPFESMAGSPNRFDEDDHSNNQVNDHLLNKDRNLSGLDNVLHSTSNVEPYYNSSKMGFDNSFEKRRKKRHAMTFQRKRPADTLHRSSKEESWFSDKYQEDDSSASSSSKSGIVDVYGRSFRQARWYHHRPAKFSRVGEMKPSHRRMFVDNEASQSQKTVRSNSFQTARGSNNPQQSRRLALSEQQAHGSRNRISRRPDRMCQLTLLDRLVLGLNCSVSQNDDEIHIKQLHVEELTILTQRMSRTGFFMQSLALRQNANNDAEYNIVLTFSADNENNNRRNKCLNSRSKIDDQTPDFHAHMSDRSGWKKMKPHNRSKRISCSASKRFLSGNLARSDRSLIPSSSTSDSIPFGYQSDSGLSVHKLKHFSGPRKAYSDVENEYSKSHSYFIKILLSRKISASCSNMSGKANRLSKSTSVDASDCSTKPFTRHGEHSNYNWSKGDSGRSRLTLDNNLLHKRGMLASRVGSLKEADQMDLNSDEEASLNTMSSNVFQSQSKRTTNIMLGSTQAAPFRRHSPRKVIRKVYTGSLTIPKILNRKRPSGAFSGVLSSSSANTTVTSGSYSSSGISVCSTTSNISCTSATNNTTCLVSSSASGMFLQDNQNNPLCSPPTSQFRRLQATVTPVGLIQPPVGTISQSKPSIMPFTSLPVSSTLSEQRASNIKRLHNASQLSVNHSAVQQHMDLVSSHSKNYQSDITNDVSTASTEPEVSTNVIGSATTILDTVVKSIGAQGQEKTHPDNSELEMLTARIEPQFSATTPNIDSYGTNCPDTISAPVNEEEMIVGADGSRTPATSLSASQLLKLKRLHDEVTPSPGKSTKTQCSGSTVAIQPGTSHMQTQSQSIESETTHTQQQQQQHSIPQRSSTVLPNSEYGSDACSFTAHLNPDLHQQHHPKTTNSNLEIDEDDDDMDDFELKPVSKIYDLNDNQHDTDFNNSNSFYHSFASHSSVSMQPTKVVCSNSSNFNELSGTSAMNNLSVLDTQSSVGQSSANVSFSANHPNAFKTTSRFNWPVGRTSFNQTFSPGFRLSSSFTPNLMRSASDLDQHKIATQVLVQNPNLDVRYSTIDHGVDPVVLSGKPVIASSLSSSLSSTFASTLIPGSCMASGTAQMNPVNNSQICVGPLKRTVVHKYHSFRRILPKSLDRPMLFPTTPGFNMVSLNAAHNAGIPVGLSKIPIIGNNNHVGFIKSGTFQSNPHLSSEIQNDGSYYMDLAGTNFSDVKQPGILRRSSIHLTGSSSSVLASNPASQLLKSLLERGDSRESNSATSVASAVGTNANIAFIPSTFIGSSASSTYSNNTGVFRNQPAHQSRGTWQLGKRSSASSGTGLHRSASDSTSSGASNHATGSTSTNLNSVHSQAALGDCSDSVRSPPINPPTLRLAPGSVSRLQQLQQHYQRQQEAQLRFGQDSSSVKLGVADSI